MESVEEKVRELKKEVPCRESQIDLLISLMGDNKRPACPSLFIYGHTATAKSLVVKSIFKRLKFTYAFVNCIEMYSQRILFETILSQLSQFTTEVDDDFRCLNMNDFVRYLKDIISSSEVQEETIYIVMDQAERLRNMANNILPAFLKLQELLNANVCVILISELVWEKFRNGTTFYDPVPIHFPNYKYDELIQILSLDCPCEYTRDFYVNYVNLILSVFHPICRDLSELKYLCNSNFKIYCKPIETNAAQINDVKKLWRNFEPQLKKSLQSVYLREVSNTQWENSRESQSGLISQATPKEVLELPFYSKFLLIAAYLASYNPSKSDKRFFLKHHGKIRKTAKSMKKNERLTNHVLGPKLFPLDRLLAIFYSIVEDRVTPSALIFSQISSLVSLHLISQCDSVDVLQTPKYKCLITLDCVRSIAKTVNFDIIRYLYDFI